MNYKLSFLMAAHNEEKIISIALKRLIQVQKDYPNMELLIGLDGCTDKTADIVKKLEEKFKFIKLFELNERKGKQSVLDKLEPYITGDIIIIHDADWSFVYKSKKELLGWIKIFDNKKIGGISESFSSEKYHPNFEKIDSLGFVSSAWGNHLLVKYCKEKFTKIIDEEKKIRVYEREKTKFFPFLDVYRRDVMKKTKHKKELRAGDHVERSLRIWKAGYEIAAFDNPDWPRFIENYTKQSVKDFSNQKIRGVISKKKVQSSYKHNIPFFGFYIPFFFYVIWNSFKVNRFRDFFAIHLYLFIMIYAQIIAKFKEKISAKEIWKLRMKR